MPSRKVTAAARETAPRPLTTSAVRNNVRQGIVPSDPELARVQEDIRSQNEKLLEGTPFRNGKILTIEFDGTNVVDVEHKLGGPLSGFIPVDIISPVAVAVSIVRGENSTLDGRADTHIRAFASAACTAKLWVWR